MPKLGPLELVIILLVVLVLFGPKNLPKLGSAIGTGMKNLREGMNSTSDTAAKSAPAQTAAAETVETAAEEEQPVNEKPSPKHTDKTPVGVQ